MGQDTYFSKNCKARKRKVKEGYGLCEFNNILNLLKTEKTYVYLLQLLKLCLSFEFLQKSLIIKDLIKYETKFNKKSFANKKILKNDFQNYDASRKAIKSNTRTFCGSLHNEIDVK